MLVNFESQNFRNKTKTLFRIKRQLSFQLLEENPWFTFSKHITGIKYFAKTFLRFVSSENQRKKTQHNIFIRQMSPILYHSYQFTIFFTFKEYVYKTCIHLEQTYNCEFSSGIYILPCIILKFFFVCRYSANF